MEPTGPTNPSTEGEQAAAGPELDSGVHLRIVELSDRGDELCERDEFAQARSLYDDAIGLLPEPKMQWSAWTWLQAALGDTYYFESDWDACGHAFRMAVAGPDGIGNPFIHLRLGQCALKLGDEDRARDELMRAYMGGGAEIFDDVEPEYLRFLKRFAAID